MTLPAYRGDAVNGLEFTAAARTPDPERLLQVYNTSAATLNLVRAFTHGGFADLRQVHAWNQGFVRESTAHRRYELMARDIDRALEFMDAFGVDSEEMRTVDLYSSHEALLLGVRGRAHPDRLAYRHCPTTCPAHFVWLGERTRQLDGAHVDFAAAHAQPDRGEARTRRHRGRCARPGRAARPRPASRDG